MLRMAVGPSSQKVVSDELMIGAAKLARKYEGVRLHTHLAENQVSMVWCTCTSPRTQTLQLASS